MANKLDLFELQEQHYENRTTGSQKYLIEEEDSQEMYEDIDNISTNKTKTGNTYFVFGKSTKEGSNTAVAGTVGLQTCLTEEGDSQETYENIDNINIKQTKTGNIYSVFGNNTIESSNTAVAGVQETSFEQSECSVTETNATILPQRVSTIRKWKILSIISQIVIIALTVALVTVLILMFVSKVSPCEGLECLHMGTCSSAGDKAICNCQTGYYGDRCQFTPCTNATCLNEGQCIVWNNSYICICTDGYSGKTCQDDLCSGSPCLNQGTCTPRSDRFDCSCRNGYYGDRCENDPCTRSPCLNQGTCTSRGARYDCSCRNGYIGDICENYICSSSPCLNQGTCTPRGDRYNCSCMNGYYGERCELTPCTNETCLNEGQCIVWNNSYICICTDGYSGRTCQDDLCTRSPCLNNGTCSSFVDRYNCSCDDAYYGDRCENEGSYVEAIQSPGFPSNYPHNLKKIWKINVGSGHVAVLRFKNFSTEYGYDYVTVYAGDSTSSKLLYKWCGRIVPTEMRTTGQQLTVEMTTDGSVTTTGFAADVYKIKK